MTPRQVRRFDSNRLTQRAAMEGRHSLLRVGGCNNPIVRKRCCMGGEHCGLSGSNTNCSKINSEGFLAEVFHPWVRWEGPGSGFENSSGAAGAGASGVWKSKWAGPSGWAHAGPKWVGPSWAHTGGPKCGPKPGPSGWVQDTQIWPPWD